VFYISASNELLFVWKDEKGAVGFTFTNDSSGLKVDPPQSNFAIDGTV